MYTKEEKEARSTARKEARKEAKRLALLDSLRNQKSVRTIEISIEWAKSRTWGSNPHASARVQFEDGSWDYAEGFTASGCGYDKESTVIADIFNEYLAYTLFREYPDEQKKYGMSISKDNTYQPYFSGGIGTNCYFDISKAIGGTFERTGSGKMFDCYRFTMTQKTAEE